MSTLISAQIASAAWLSVIAMAIHLLLPLGRDSVADAHQGWAFWVKDAVEGLDAVLAVCILLIAWALGREGIVSSRILGLLGMAGGMVTAVFSVGVPLTPALVPMDVAHALIPAVPIVGMLATASWTIGAGFHLVRQDSTTDHTMDRPPRGPRQTRNTTH